MAITNKAVKDEFDKYEVKLNKAVDHYVSELTAVRAGRANPAILNKVTVDYYGTMTSVSQMANISVPEARLITITPWDASTVKAITKAIIASDIGINPSDDGKIIRLVFPQLTEERRKELIKQIKKICEDSKVVLRNERRDIVEIIKKFKKDNIVTEDEVSLYEKEVQKVLDKNVETLDKLLTQKEKEIIEI